MSEDNEGIRKMQKNIRFEIKPSGSKTKNTLATICQIFGVMTFLGGVILGISAYGWIARLTLWFSGFYFGVLYLIIANIIKILQMHQTQNYEVIEVVEKKKELTPEILEILNQES